MRPQFFYISLFFFILSLTATAIPGGKKYMVFIAVNNYSYWNSLSRPVNEARALRDVLVQDYQVDEVILCFNSLATKEGIVKLFLYLESKMTRNDSLFLYYAGHGSYDNQTDIGYLVPSDGGIDEVAKNNWISQFELQGFVRNFKASQILLVLDTCFSGSLVTPFPGSRNSEETDIPSRLVLSAGGVEKIPDDSGFSSHLIKVLLKNSNPLLYGRDLYYFILKEWNNGTPGFGSLANTGHIEGGTYTFVHKQKIRDKRKGALLIKVDNEGVLYLDGNLYSREQGAILVEELKSREFLVEIYYPDLSHYREEVYILPGQRKEVEPYFIFSGKKQERNWGVAMAIGPSFPRDYWALGFGPGLSFDFRGTFLWEKNNFTLEAGFLAGYRTRYSIKESYFPGWFTNVPLHLLIGIATIGKNPLSCGVQLSGGRSLLYFMGEEEQSGDCWSLSPEVDLLFSLSPLWQAGLSISSDILFLDQVHWSLGSGLKIKKYFK